MAEQSIACPSCGKKIPLTRALRAEIETSLKAEFGERERELRDEYERKLDAERERVEKDAAKRAEKKLAQELAGLKDQLKDQAKEIEDARRVELALRKREQALERQQADLEVTIARTLADERAKLVTETQERAAEQHRLKDAEKERQLGEMRRQIEDLKRKADQGSQQLQGEAGEGELETILRERVPDGRDQRDRTGRPRRRHPPHRRRRARREARRDPLGVQERAQLERRLDREAEGRPAVAARGRRRPRHRRRCRRTAGASR